MLHKTLVFLFLLTYRCFQPTLREKYALLDGSQHEYDKRGISITQLCRT